MEITLNGELANVDNNTSIAQLLMDQKLSNRRIAVELNELIVPRSQFEQTIIQAGDKLEIVHAIGGG